MSMNVKTMFLFLLVGGAGHQALVAAAATGAGSLAFAQASVNLDSATLTQNPATRVVEVSYTLTGNTPAGRERLGLGITGRQSRVSY